MLRINPLQEELYLRLIRIHLEMGDRAAALHQYERCCKTLREELNISPMEETKKIYEDIRTHRTTVINKAKSERKSNNRNELSNISVPCYPIDDVKYYWLANLIKEIIKTYDSNALKELPKLYWKDIYRIESSVAEIIEDIKIEDNLSIETEKNRIFNAVLELIYIILEHRSLNIEVSNIQFMDDVSFQFLKLLLFKLPSVGIRIKGDKTGHRVAELKGHFPSAKI